MNCTQFADKYFGKYTTKNSEIVPELCPYCKGGRKSDKNTFALNTDKLTYNCKRGSCAKTGTFYQLKMDFGESEKRNDTVSHSYKKPAVKLEETSKCESYLNLRKISKETWQKAGVKEKDGAIAFPYYENGELVAVKYRSPDKKKKIWKEKDGKPVFWCMDQCDHYLPLIITEGEFDALALKECKFDNVVSVPNGSSDLNCVDLCWEWLEQFTDIIIWPDNDKPGQEMKDNLIKRLGEWRCAVVRSPHKDANEHLYKEGLESTKDAVISAKKVEIQGLLKMSEVEAFDWENTTRVKSGITQLDSTIGGFMTGSVSVWTGINSSGKSTLLGQLLIESIDQGFSVCGYSGELPAALFRYWIELQMAGNSISEKYDPIKNGVVHYLDNSIQEKLRSWYGNRFFLYDSFGSSTDEDILRVFEYAARRHNCKVFLIDNLMTTAFTGRESDYYRKQSEFVGRVIDFAHKFDCHVHIVAHPRKKEGRLSKMDVMGAGDITNRADNVFGIHRLKNEDKQGEYQECDAILDVFKNRFLGKQDVEVGLQFEERSKRFMNVGSKNKTYGWEKNGL